MQLSSPSHYEHFNPAESAQPHNPAESAPTRSASLTDVVAIRGGGIPLDDAINHAWLVKPETIEGRSFVDISAQDARCRRYFGHNFAMVTHIKTLRDRKVLELMRALAKDEDPNETNAGGKAKLPDRPKRELIDKLPQIIDIDVVTNNGIQATVSVIPSWRDKGALQIELTEENMDLMLEAPPAESARFNPNLAGFPQARWVAKRGHVRCSYWDSKREMIKMHSQKVEFAPDDTPEEKESLVHAAAAAVQEFYNTHHNLGDNCSGEPRGEGGEPRSEGEPPLKIHKSEEIMSAGSAQPNSDGTDC